MRFQQEQLGIGNKYLTKQASRSSVDKSELFERIESAVKHMSEEVVQRVMEMAPASTFLKFAGFDATLKKASESVLVLMLDMMVKESDQRIQAAINWLINTVRDSVSQFATSEVIAMGIGGIDAITDFLSTVAATLTVNGTAIAAFGSVITMAALGTALAKYIILMASLTTNVEIAKSCLLVIKQIAKES